LDLVGRENDNATAQALGLRETLVHTYTAADPLRPSDDNATSARDLGMLLLGMAQGELVDEAASDEMLALMLGERANNWMVQDLPRGLYVAHKTGSLPGVRNDAGVIWGHGMRAVLVVLTDGARDQDLAEETIGKLARALYDALSDDRRAADR
jgi:beta-lactamase class A